MLQSTANKEHILAMASSLCFLLLSTNIYAQEKDPVADVTETADTLSETSNTQPDTPANIKSRIILTNGDRLTGQPHSVNENGNLSFTSKSLRSKAEFPINKILTLELDTWEERKQVDTVARIQLQPSFRETIGDTITGELHGLTSDSIEIKTWYGGIINIKRSMAKSWTSSEKEKPWEFHNGSLISKSSQSIGRDVGLKEKSHVRFKVQWESSMRFRIHFYSSDITDSSPDAYYDVNFNRTYAYLRTRGRGGRAGGGRWKQIRNTLNGTQAQFDIFMDRKAGIFTIYIDGKQACILQSQNPDPENLGTGLSFIAEERYPIEISSISVSPWNGSTLPNQKLPAEDDNTEQKDPETEEPPHHIVLQNGDEVPGTAGKVQDGLMVVETEYTPIRIPINRIKSLRQGNSEEQPRKYSKDVRAWFHDGNHITLRLASFTDGKISGYNQALGEVAFDLKAFNKIDFHIYDQKYNDLRSKDN